MKIALNDIKGMDKRVRQSMSPEALEELADSIKEMGGLIVPVKVRQNGDGYELVYGHRRVAAAKMAGLSEIEAFVQDVPEDKLLTQALVENVVREDMPALDVAKALRQIQQEAGATQAEVGAMFGHSGRWVARHLKMLDPDLGLDESTPASVTESTVDEAVAGAGGDKKLARKVIDKATEDTERPLSKRDTRRLAEVTRKANEFGGAKAVSRMLEKSADEILRAADPVEDYKKPRTKKKEVEKTKGEPAFQWVRDPRVILAEDGVKAISAAVSAIARSDQDRGGGRAVLKKMRGRVETLLNQINDVLEDYDA